MLSDSCQNDAELLQVAAVIRRKIESTELHCLLIKFLMFIDKKYV